MANILYISLTGMTEPLGRSQVLEYLFDLSKNNKFFIISFERDNDADKLQETSELVKKHNIEWFHFSYSNRFGLLSSVYQVSRAVLKGFSLIKKNSIEIVHVRSFIPAVIGLVLKKITDVKLLFDIRGFAIDEKLDSGRFTSDSFIYKKLKKLDNYLYQSSDHIVTLTHSAKDTLSNYLQIVDSKFSVIPTCANKSIFKTIDKNKKQKIRKQLGFSDTDIILVHTGTVLNRYDFFAEILLFKELLARDQRFKFLIVNKDEHEYIRGVFKEHAISENDYRVLSSAFDQVYKYLNISDFSLFFIPPTFAKKAMAPTKFAENVACLLPSITNQGVGDMDFYLFNYQVGYVVDLDSVHHSLTQTGDRVMEYVKNNPYSESDYEILFSEYFDKKNAVIKYQKIYDALL